MNKCLIGTSGWFYQHWLGRFYPEHLKTQDYLKHYTKYFNTVELNSSFYHLPKETTVQGWYNKVPKDFIFAPKASKVITHYQKLLNSRESLDLFLSRLKILKDKLGPVLYQLPPSLKKDIKLLSNFIKLLPKEIKHTIEFRNRTWLEKDVFKLLEDKNIAFCIISLHNFPIILETTADFTYLRFHGAEGKYSSSYTDKQLRDWAKKIKNFLKNKLDVYVYFNNDANAYAVNNAKKLKEYLKC